MSEGAPLETAAVGTPITYEEGETAALLLGIQAIVGFVWWFACFFLFITQASTVTGVSANNLSTYGVSSIPFYWMWTGLTNSAYIWTALTYLFIFLTFGMAAVPEMFMWIMYLVGHDVTALAWYVTTIGYWVSIVGYFFPFLWATIQLLISPVSGTSTHDFFPNSIF